MADPTTGTPSTSTGSLTSGIESWVTSAWNWVNGVGQTVSTDVATGANAVLNSPIGQTVSNDVKAITSLPGTVASGLTTGINAISLVPVAFLVVAVIVILRLTAPKNLKTTVSAAKALL